MIKLKPQPVSLFMSCEVAGSAVLFPAFAANMFKLWSGSGFLHSRKLFWKISVIRPWHLLLCDKLRLDLSIFLHFWHLHTWMLRTKRWWNCHQMTMLVAFSGKVICIVRVFAAGGGIIGLTGSTGLAGLIGKIGLSESSPWSFWMFEWNVDLKFRSYFIWLRMSVLGFSVYLLRSINSNWPILAVCKCSSWIFKALFFV